MSSRLPSRLDPRPPTPMKPTRTFSTGGCFRPNTRCCPGSGAGTEDVRGDASAPTAWVRVAPAAPATARNSRRETGRLEAFMMYFGEQAFRAALRHRRGAGQARLLSMNLPILVGRGCCRAGSESWLGWLGSSLAPPGSWPLGRSKRAGRRGRRPLELLPLNRAAPPGHGHSPRIRRPAPAPIPRAPDRPHRRARWPGRDGRRWDLRVGCARSALRLRRFHPRS